jgi:hypothetical protein
MQITVPGHYMDAPDSAPPTFTGINLSPYFASPQFRQYGPAMNFVGKAFIVQIGAVVALPLVAGASVPSSVAATCLSCALSVGADTANFGVDLAETLGNPIQIETTNIGSALGSALEYGQQALMNAWKYIQTISGP